MSNTLGRVALIACITILVGQRLVAQQTVVTLVPKADAFVAEGRPDQQNGSSSILRIGTRGDRIDRGPKTGAHHAYVRFDLSSIPKSAVVTGVILEATQTDGDTYPYGIEAFPAAAAWEESEITWGNAPGAVSSSVFATGRLPSGGRFDRVDDALLALVQSWVSDPQTNTGLVFKPKEPVKVNSSLGPPNVPREGDTLLSREADGTHVLTARCPITLTVGYNLPGKSTPWTSQVAASRNFNKTFIGSPSIVRLDNGDILASHDLWGEESGTYVYRSKDDGRTWAKLDEEYFGAGACTLFTSGNAVYLLGATDGKPVIWRSEDHGETWSPAPADKEPAIELLQTSPKTRYHTAPTPVVVSRGRVLRAMEHVGRQTNLLDYLPGVSKKNKNWHAAILFAPSDSDLLDPNNWSVSNCVNFSKNPTPGEIGAKNNYWEEGNVVEGPNGEIWVVIRVNNYAGGDVDTAAVLTLDPETMKLSFDARNDFIKMPGGSHKFTIRRDPRTGKYLALVNENTDSDARYQRNVVSLAASDNLRDWEVKARLLVGVEKDWKYSIGKTAFSYIDWQFDGESIIYVARTAYDGAKNYHDTNRLTYHVVRDYVKAVRDSNAAGRAQQPCNVSNS